MSEPTITEAEVASALEAHANGADVTGTPAFQAALLDRLLETQAALDETDRRLYQAMTFLRALANSTSPEDEPSWVEISRWLEDPTVR